MHPVPYLKHMYRYARSYPMQFCISAAAVAVTRDPSCTAGGLGDSLSNAIILNVIQKHSSPRISDSEILAPRGEIYGGYVAKRGT